MSSVTTHPSTLVRLRGLLRVLDATRGADLPTLLAEIAAAVSESLGFRTVVVNLYRPAWDDLEVATVHGSDEARQLLLGQAWSVESWQRTLDDRFLWSGAYFVSHGDHDWGTEGVKSFVPDVAPLDEPGAWDPADALFVPMRSSDGSLLGVLSVDEPVSGLVPTDDELDVLVAVAAHAALAVETAQHEAEAAEHRASLERLLEVSSRLTKTQSIDEMLEAVCDGIRDALGLQRVSVDLLAENGRFRVAATAGWADTLKVGSESASLETVEPVLVPAHELEGCYVLTGAEAAALVPDARVAYSSVRNGRGPRGWDHHWLLVPLYDRVGAVRGMIWADEPVDNLVPSRPRLQALRTFANQAAAALEATADVEALRQVTESRAALVEAVPVAIVVVDNEGLVTLWNPGAERLFGWTADEALGGQSPCVPPEERDVSRALQLRVLAGEHFADMELRRLRKDGTMIDVNMSSARIRDAAGAPVRAITMYADVTERNRAEGAARRAAQRFELAAVATQSPVYELDYATGATVWTAPFEQIYGYPVHAVVETLDWWAERVHPDDHQDALQFALEDLAAGCSYEHAYRFKAADGGWRHVLDRGVVYDSGEGKSAIGAMIDVTEQRQLADQLRQSQKLEAIGRLAGGVAHDFNNLLTAIAGYGELALAKAERGQSPRRDIAEILRSASRAAALTHQLLAFGRNQVLEPQVLDLNAVVVDLDGLLRRLIGKNVDLVTQLASDLGTVEADPGQIEQIVVNLGMNASDAMPEGGKLVVKTANASVDSSWGEDDVTFGDYVGLSVTDTGTGMDAETRERLFEPFFTTKSPGKGTGLGLPTVYGIAKQSGGFVRVESTEGAGTTFEIYFPRTDATPDSGPIEEPDSETRAAATVLLVDDEQIVRSLVSEVLVENGFFVLEAPDGSEALRIASEHDRIDLLLTDVVMPSMGGNELARRFEPLHPDSGLLYMSGYTDGAAVVGGGAMFLQKPFTMDKLVAKVGEVLESRAQTGSSASE